MTQEQQFIRTDQLLSTEDVQALRDHVEQHGVTELPFGATVQTPTG
ncbi:hypothetical protein [Streptomyces sp. NPDC005969]